MSETLKLAKQLICCHSVTPDDAGCQKIIAQRLATIGFSIEILKFNDVDNLWARRGSESPLFVFAGHTDVVPPGPLDEWQSDPFAPTERDGKLYGRGAADMKGSLAAMVTATETFVDKHPDHQGSIGFLITSDEEGIATDGTVKVVETLEARGEKINWCLVGEPSSSRHIGDVIKNGRRGSLSGTLTIHGQQGHVAYPQLADNPIHRVSPVLAELCATQWDRGNEFFPPTTFQISNIHAGTGANNVIPGEIDIVFNFRFSTESSESELCRRVESLLQQHRLDYTVQWHLSGQPFITQGGPLIDAVEKTVKAITGYPTQLSTAGGTSDGRFIAPTGAEVVELGPVNATIHKINEHISLSELELLPNIYEAVLEQLLTGR